jgi:hypothetical protein
VPVPALGWNAGEYTLYRPMRHTKYSDLLLAFDSIRVPGNVEEDEVVNT